MRGRMSQWNPRIAAVFLMAVLVTLLHWTTPHAGKVSEVRIGNILPLTGPSASAGRQNRSAIELATEYVNAAGGIKSLGGARLVNAWADTRGEVAFGMSAVEHLIKNEKVSVISGAWNSAVTYPTTQAAEQAKIPYVVPVSVRDTITDRGFKYVFRTAPKDGWRSRDQFRFLRDMTRSTRTKVETLALVFENGGWGTSMKDQWTKLATSQGYRVVLVEPYDDAATDLTVTVMKIRNAQPDVILLASFTEDAVLLASAMSTLKVGAKAVIASGGGHGGNAFLESAGKSCEYLFDVSGWEPDMDRPAIAPLNEEFRKRFGFELSAETADAFASVYVIARALEEAESTEPEDIRDELTDIEMCRGKGWLGTDILACDCIEFDRTGQNRHAGYVVVQFRKVGGSMERVTVWPESAARKGFKPVFPMP
ncbi:MAG TPA: ABC transporter substrate-binding protein [Deltaproteobacteria bacterium]|nr:ABC transporter substrate-binding protein [Deltaproteobacteria bacterium]HNS89719.1 ABC transporter substrate-binding protein [Deltaproteobacteria bacterium]HOA44452.1 ABC transporter substrate-binding protein [Deltaproteobacteria bacterium]HOC75238.1 ABC transporter substrate-binding protein [Deltaproteobacteria bacterium]HOG83674.1 ABC transporter substrate-binding protein [Deltaproteobacteria bacterium]